MKRERWLHAARGILCLALMLCMIGSSVPVAQAKVTQAEIDSLKGDAKDLQSEMKKLENKLSELKNDRSAVVKKKNVLDEKISTTSQQITNMETQINLYTQLIAEAEAELADAEAREEAQYELFCERVRAMEEKGEANYWSFLFGADSFSELLGRLDIVNQIMDYDQGVIADLKSLQADIAEKKAGLETNKADSETTKAELEAAKASLDSQRSEANALIAEIRADEASYADAIDELEREEEEILAEIVRKSKELAAQQSAGQKSNPGGYIWPVDSRYITSTVGGRNSPGGIGSTNHKGTDIGRVGYNSKIYAAKDGTVIVSQYSSSYGNYVAISHGSGNTTLYAHMSSRKVSVGQVVKQGDVIGITGSTGNSTGPHLHFEITENGVRVNPLSHGATPQKGYLSGYTLSGTAVSK